MKTVRINYHALMDGLAANGGGRCGRSVIRDPRTGRLAVTGVRRAVECCGSCATCRRTCGGCWGLRGGYVVFDDHGANNKLA